MKMFLLGAFFTSSLFFFVHAQQATQTQRIPLFENDDVKVWNSVIFPDAPLAMHRHEHPRVIVAMTGGTMKIVEQNGPRRISRLGNRQSLLAPRQSAQHHARRRQRRRQTDRGRRSRAEKRKLTGAQRKIVLNGPCQFNQPSMPPKLHPPPNP